MSRSHITAIITGDIINSRGNQTWLHILKDVLSKNKWKSISLIKHILVHSILLLALIITAIALIPSIGTKFHIFELNK